jgi:Cu/Ag efflux pump CusA
VVLFVISLALIPTIGGEFMPKLDEGALIKTAPELSKA